MKRVAFVVAGTVVALGLSIPPAHAPCHSIGFTQTTYQVGEGAGKVTVTVTNNGGQQTQAQMVDYATANGTAKSPMDYTAKNGTITFTVGASGEVPIDIPIKNDAVDEPAETFKVKLSNARPPSSCAPPPSISGDTTTVTIVDNDKPKPKPTPSPTRRASSPSPTPSPTRTPSPSPSLTPSESPSPTPTVVAAPDGNAGSGLTGGAVAAIVGGVVVLGGAAAIVVRRRFLS